MLKWLMITFAALLCFNNPTSAQSAWNKEAARDYLDSRAKYWSQWNSASRDGGSSRCVACHTGLTYAMVRRPLGKALGELDESSLENALFNNVKHRVADQDRQLYYQFSEQKKLQSKGTEAVINAFILTFRDHHHGNPTLADQTRTAFDELWKSQVPTGKPQSGSWHWLDFRLEPWESVNAQYYGAALAAIALGNTPISYKESDALADAKNNLFKYLKTNFDDATLHGKLYAYWAHLCCGDVLTDQQISAMQHALKETRSQSTGAWALKDLLHKEADDNRGRLTETHASDGYATGLAVFVLLKSGEVPDEIDIQSSLNWLRKNQLDDGSWPARSVNKDRDPNSHTGKFMRDAATTFAVLALLESERK